MSSLISGVLCLNFLLVLILGLAQAFNTSSNIEIKENIFKELIFTCLLNLVFKIHN